MNRILAFGLRQAPLFLAMVIVLVAIVRIPAFQRLDYWFELVHQNFAAAALALALTPIILTGGIDLSVGSITVLASVVIGGLWRAFGWPIELALAGGVLAGLCAGVANGLLVRIGILPLVATLATRELLRGLALSLSSEPPVDRFPPQWVDLWRTPIFGLPIPLLLLALLFVVTYILVHHTWIGRMLYAIGDNEQAARFAAVPVDRLKLGIYLWAGFVAGLCGAASVLEYDSAKADVDKSLELAAIACVVLGGVRITGGSGSVAGSAVGILTLVVLLSGLLAVAPEWRETVTGAMLILVAMANEAAARLSLRLQLARPRSQERF